MVFMAAGVQGFHQDGWAYTRLHPANVLVYKGLDVALSPDNRIGEKA